MSRQKSILFCGLLILSMGLMTSAGLKAAGPVKDIGEWNNLKELTSGQKIQVVLNDAESYRGKFQSVTEDALTVRLANGEQRFGRRNILRVSAKGKSHRLRNTFLGAAIGFGLGGGIGYIVAKQDPEGGLTFSCGHGAAALIGAGSGLAGGTAVGAALPTGGWHEIYRAR